MIAAFSGPVAGSVVVDMCAYDLRRPDTGELVRKSTMLKGSRCICLKLQKGRCDRQHQHSHIMGTLAPNAAKIKGSVSSWAGGYTKEFSQAVLEAAEETLKGCRLKSVKIRRMRSAFPLEQEDGDVERDEAGNVIEEIILEGPPASRARTGKERESVPEEATMTTEEEPPGSLWSENEIPEGERREILDEVPGKIRRQVRKTHRGFGHPGRETMLRMMRLGGASPAAIRYARVWQCPVCAQIASPPKMMTASPTVRPYGLTRSCA